MQLPYLNTASPLQLYFFSLNLSANIFVCDIKSQLSKSLHWTPFYVMISSTLWKRACAVLASCPIIIINIVEFYQYATEVHVCNMDCYEKHFVNSCIIAVSNIMLNGNFCILILNYLDFFLSMDVNFVLNFVAAPKMPSYFCCFPISFSFARELWPVSSTITGNICFESFMTSYLVIGSQNGKIYSDCHVTN